MKIVGFGDFLIRFNPQGYERFIQANSMNISFTGAEANVCSALSYWGENCEFVTSLPPHELAKHGLNFLKGLGINVENCAEGQKRMGLFFLEHGASLRGSKVIYDRFDSSFTNSNFGDYDWDKILKDANVLFLTGITPVLSDNLYDCCLKLLKKAKEKNVFVVYDVNFRSTLSSSEKAGWILRNFAPYISLLIGNEEHLKMLLNIDSKYSEDETEARLKDITYQASKILNINDIAITVRRTLSASDNIVFAGLTRNGEFNLSTKKQVHIVDRVGSGDAFSAGLIYAILNNFSNLDAVEFAVASNALKHTIDYDVNFSTVNEIKNIMGANSRVDVKR